MFKSSCEACRVHRGTARWLFKQCLTCPAEAAVNTRVELTNSANFYYEDALKPYSYSVQFLLKRYITFDNPARLNVEVRNLRQESMTAAKNVQELLTKILSC